MIVYIDLDGTIADFEKARKNHPLSSQTPYIGRPDRLPEVYKDLEPIDGSIMAVKELLQNKKYEVYILSSAPWDNPDAWTHKRLWVERYFGKAIRNRLILSKRKDLMIGDILIDDSPYNGARDFRGKWIQFGSINFDSWITVLDHIKSF